MNIANLLARAARTHADSPALYLGERLLADYRTLAERAARLASALSSELGALPGDRVAVVMSNVPEYLEVLYGSWFAGLAVAPLNAKLHAAELASILRDLQPCVVFFSADLLDLEREVAACVPEAHYVIVAAAPYQELLRHAPMTQPENCSPEDVAWIFYTSGTTGAPKGVMLAHRNLFAMTSCFFTDVERVEHEDAVVYAAPMSHAAGLWSFAYIRSASRHIIPESGGFEPAELMSLADRFGRLCLFAVPTMVRRLAQFVEASGWEPSGLRTILYAGGPMYLADIRHALRVMGDKFVQIYGQGESPMTITALARRYFADREHPRYLQRLASVGVAETAVEIRVVDEHGSMVAPGVQGEILVRGETVMKGYWRNPEATAQALRDGWLHTGDVGSLDEDGFLTLTDRIKDLIISGGSNIYPREIEDVLLNHPLVSAVAVVGRPHPDWGEEVVAFVQARSGFTVSAQQLDALCLGSLARYKRPRQYFFVDELPQGGNGKVLKAQLRQRLAHSARDSSRN